jgi:pimeloyl-ACP methyl ester carboxylesterase
MTLASATADRVVRINGINIAFQLQGEGPPLVLVMGYRLSSVAWPAKLLEALARNFTVITFDNRGTGRSDKPLTGYALANMARDVAGLLDEIGIESTYVLGYSMGGAIAQEFTRQFAHRVAGLILCATMCGGPRATYAEASVVRVMRDLDGLSAEQIARRIWEVTYAPGYLRENRGLAEDQMRRGNRAAYTAARCGPAISGICRVRRLEGAFTNPMPYARLDRRPRPADPA